MIKNNTTGETDVTCVTWYGTQNTSTSYIFVTILKLVQPFNAHTAELSDSRSNFVFAGALMTILFALVRLFKEALQLCYDTKSYLSHWVNWFEITLYILSIIFAFVFKTTCMCSQEWQWELGVVVVSFAWIELIIICAKSPSIGIYIIMFRKIILTFLKVIILPVLLVIMFGLTFYMIFSEPQFQISNTCMQKTIVIQVNHFL